MYRIYRMKSAKAPALMPVAVRSFMVFHFNILSILLILSFRPSMAEKKLRAIEQRPGEIDPDVAPFGHSGFGIFLRRL